MMKTAISKILLIFVLCGVLTGNTHAASIWLEVDPNHGVGDTVTVRVMVDASDEPILAGGFDIFVTNLGSVVGYTGFTFDPAFLGPIADPNLSRAPDYCAVDTTAPGCGSPDELNGLAFGSFAGIGGPHLVGVMTFDALAVGPIQFTMADNDSPAGGWFSTAGNAMTVDYYVVPLPAAVWLMLSGVGMLLGFGRFRFMPK
jgi:hypothetical protein